MSGAWLVWFYILCATFVGSCGGSNGRTNALYGEGEAAKVGDQGRWGRIARGVCEGYREADKRGNHGGEVGGEGEGMLEPVWEGHNNGLQRS